MRTFKKYALVAVGLLILGPILDLRVGSLIAAPPAQSPKPPAEVLVVNPPAEPVPTSISGTPTVQLAAGTSVGVTGNVSLAPGSAVGINPANNTVQVGNTEANPIPVRNADPAQPFQVDATFFIDIGLTAQTLALATVPPGKRLVIEHVSLLAEAPAGQAMGARISTRAGGTFAAHHLALIGQGPLFGVPAFGASQPMRVYADPSTTVLGIVFRSETTGRADAILTVSGHLVDAP